METESASERVVCDRPDPLGIKTAVWDNSLNFVPNLSRGWRPGRNSNTHSSQMLPGASSESKWPRDGRRLDLPILAWGGAWEEKSKPTPLNGGQERLGNQQGHLGHGRGLGLPNLASGWPPGENIQKRSPSEGTRSVLGITRAIHGKGG